MTFWIGMRNSGLRMFLGEFYFFVVVVVVVVGFVLLSRGFCFSIFLLLWMSGFYLDSGYGQLGVAVFRA